MSDNMMMHNGQQYREVQRKANVGELVKVVDAGRWSSAYENGEIINVIGTDGGWERNAVYGDNRQFKNLYDDQYVVLEPIADTSPDSLEWRLARSEELVDRLTMQAPTTPVRGDMGLRRIVDYVESNKAEYYAKVTSYTREQVIEMAKRDVEKLERTPIDLFDDKGERELGVPSLLNGHESFDPDIYDAVRYIVNRDKRTVVALIYYRDNGDETGKVWARGKARACDGDTFNSDIGRAISLRRALGLDVPSHYTNAPQPTVAKVGDVVRFDDEEDTFMVVGKLDNDSPAWTTNVKGPLNGFVVIDDSGEEMV